MNKVKLKSTIGALVLWAMPFIFTPHILAQEAPAASRYQEKKRQSNESTIAIVASGLNCTCTRFTEDMRNVLNDMSPGGLRILPILGVGGAQNVLDLLFLKNVDLAIVDQDLLDVVKKKDPALYGNVRTQVQYISKLFNSEFHLLAKSSVNSYDDLRGRRVNFYLKDSMTAIAAENIFRMLKIPVEPTYYDEDLALQKLVNGDLAGIAFFEGAPRPFVDRLRKSDGLRLLPLDDKSLPGRDLMELYDRYLPTDLTHEDYPNLIPLGQVVPTISNRVVLATYNWPVNSDRYNRIAKFTKKFFDNIHKFQDGPRHPKWRQVNIGADISGWTRYKPAREWLDANGARGQESNLLATFERFVRDQQGKSQLKQLSGTEKDALFVQFKAFWETEQAKKDR